MDDGPQTHHVIIPMSWGGIAGLILGIIWALGAATGVNKHAIVVYWSVGGIFIGFLLSRWLIIKREKHHHSYQEGTVFAIDTQNVAAGDGGVVLSLHIHDDAGNDTSYEIRGLTEQEWNELGRGVRKYRGFSSRILQSIFKPNRGSTIYDLTKNILSDERVKIIAPSGNGYNVTGRGWSFFEHLENENYEILGMLDTPTPSPARENV